jgi:phosphoribosyl 1,2-cyclic phosphate phosphodiesterase
MKVTILGCGASGGVPLIGCSCAVCISTNPKNKRTRCSALVEVNGARLLIDTAPDLRAQALREGFNTIDAVLYTHNHSDHTNGIDELRAFNYHAKQALPVYGTAEMLNHLQMQFGYAFLPPNPSGSWRSPSLIPMPIGEYQEFSIKNVMVQSFLQYHGKGKTLGYRIGNIAYSTDVNNLPEQSLQLLDSLDLWVVDCLRYDEAKTHAHLELTLQWIERVKPKRAVLIHMAHEMEYEQLKRELPPHVEPAHDGLLIKL